MLYLDFGDWNRIFIVTFSGAFRLLLFLLFLLLTLVRIFTEFRDGVFEIRPNVLAQLLTQSSERFGIVFVHVFPQVFVLPCLVDQVFHFDQDPDVKFRSFAVRLLLEDDGLGLLVSLAELHETCFHLVEVVDLLRVPDGLDDGVERLVALLLGGFDDAFRVFLIVTELETRKGKTMIKRTVVIESLF
jgi:hypothetical protein